eukprot:Colp12_sorted_trinity150504_noHs@7925
MMATVRAPVSAYAKLQGADFQLYVQSLSAALHINEGLNQIMFCDESQAYAMLHYNFQTRCFELHSTGKCKTVVIDGIQYSPNHPPLPLSAKTCIQLDQCCFYFLLPLPAPPKDEENKDSLMSLAHTAVMESRRPTQPVSFTKPHLSYGELLTKAFEHSSQKYHTVEEIVAKIKELYPYYVDADPKWEVQLRLTLAVNKNFSKMIGPNRTTLWKLDRSGGSNHMPGISPSRPSMASTNYGGSYMPKVKQQRSAHVAPYSHPQPGRGIPLPPLQTHQKPKAQTKRETGGDEHMEDVSDEQQKPDGSPVLLKSFQIRPPSPQAPAALRPVNMSYLRTPLPPLSGM